MISASSLGDLREGAGREARDPDLGLAHLKDSVVRVLIWGLLNCSECLSKTSKVSCKGDEMD